MLYLNNFIFLKVNFPSSSRLVRVHPMVTWSHAYRAARKGPWERLGRDADRFRERVKTTAAILEPILQKEHRDRVWRRLQTNLEPTV